MNIIKNALELAVCLLFGAIFFGAIVGMGILGVAGR